MKIKAPAALLPAALLLCALSARAQEKPDDKRAAQTQPATAAQQTNANGAAASAPKVSITPASTPLELARAAYEAQGGAKYRALKNIVLFGTADLYAPSSAQSLSGKFGMFVAGDLLRLQVESPLFTFTLVSDGERTYTSLRGFELPPANVFGIPVLLNFDKPGYVVAALPDKKKERGFSITEPGGMKTNFYVDAATGRLARFEVPYGGYTYGYEFKAMREIEGVLVPVAFTQRILTPQGAYFAEFKVKDAKLNQQLPADAFAIPNN
jgi:hypothetical protein